MANLPMSPNYGTVILEKIDTLNNKFEELNRILKKLLEEIKNGKTTTLDDKLITGVNTTGVKLNG